MSLKAPRYARTKPRYLDNYREEKRSRKKMQLKQAIAIQQTLDP